MLKKIFLSLMVIALLSHPTSVVCFLFYVIDSIAKLKNVYLKYFTIIFLDLSFQYLELLE